MTSSPTRASARQHTRSSGATGGSRPQGDDTVGRRPAGPRRPRTFRGAILPVAILLGLLLPPTASAAPGDDWPAYVSVLGGPDRLLPFGSVDGAPGTPVGVGLNPFGVAITPDGSSAYVANNGASDVTPVDLAAGTAGPGVGPVGRAPYTVAISPDGSTAWVTVFFTAEIVAIDLATGTVARRLAVPPFPYGVVLVPDGSKAVVTSNADASVSVVDLASGSIVGTAPVGAQAWDLGITPDGATAYVAAGDGTVTVVDVATVGVRSVIPVASAAWAVGITPDGATVVVGTQDGVELLDAATGTVVATLPFSASAPGISVAQDVAVTPDGLTAWVSTGVGAVAVPVDLTTRILGVPLAPGGVGGGVAIAPDQAPVAVLSDVVPGQAGSPTAFDASASTVTYGSIASYAWDFGDGTIETTAGPTTSHVYAAGGDYTVTLTLTSSGGTSTTQVYDGRSMTRNGGPQARTTAGLVVPAPPTPPPAPVPAPALPTATPEPTATPVAASRVPSALAATGIEGGAVAVLAALLVGTGVVLVRRRRGGDLG